jgi:hypothetical protein
MCVLQDNPLKQLQLRGHDDAITAFAMSPNGAMLATGQKGSNSDVVVWHTQQLAQQFRWVLPASAAHFGGAEPCELTHDVIPALGTLLRRLPLVSSGIDHEHARLDLFAAMPYL